MTFKQRVKLIEIIARITRILWTTVGLLGLFSGMFVENRVVAIVCTVIGATMVAITVEIVIMNCVD